MAGADGGGRDRAALVSRVLAAMVLAVSTVHYLDNWIRYDDYVFAPNAPIKVWMVPLGWLLFTAFGVIGLARFSRGRWWSAGICLAAYSLIGLVDAIHYTDAPPADFGLFQNITIVGNLLTGLAMAGFAGWLIAVRAIPGVGAPAGATRSGVRG